MERVWDRSYQYNGKEKIDELGLGWNDYGARNYDALLGRWMGVDALAEKYKGYNPYVYCLNTPIGAIDPNGKDVILLVWATGNGGYGHAAVAVSNYKNEYYQEQVFGVSVTKSRMIPDGTYTYYDLWPGKDTNNDGVSDVIGTAGPKDAYTGPIAHYQILANHTENTLLNSDPSNGEGKKADGVIKIYSGYDEDKETIDDLVSHMNSNKKYTSILNNCSDFACSGVAESLDRYKSLIELNGADESTLGISYTTPNSLYRYVNDRIKSNPKEGIELRAPGSVINTTFNKGVLVPTLQDKKVN